MTKAAIYCRISSDKTGEQAGVDRQLQDCESLVAAQGWSIVDRYIDNDVSATSGKTRPDYRRLLADIRGGLVDAVVAWHPDRLYRKLSDLEELITAIEKRDVVMRTVRAGEIDLSTPTGRMLARILSSVATAEGEVKSDRWRRSVRQRREQGRVHNFGPRLFGYERDGSINEVEATLVQWIATSLIEGESIRTVTRKLNDMDVGTTLGNPWSTQGLKKLIQNQRLTGASMLNGDVVGVGQWDPILDPETFEQVQAIFAVRRETGPRPPRVSLLLGLIRCGSPGCGALLKSGRLANKRRIYRCTEPKSDTHTAVLIDAETAEQYVEGYAQTRLADPAVRARIQMLATASGDAVAEVVTLEERLIELEAQLDEPGVPVASITRALQRTQEKINQLRTAAPAPVQLPAVGQWPTDIPRRARLIRVAVSAVHVDPAAKRGSNKVDTDRLRITPA